MDHKFCWSVYASFGQEDIKIILYLPFYVRDCLKWDIPVVKVDNFKKIAVFFALCVLEEKIQITS